MMQLSKALIAAGLSVAFTTACAGDRGTSSTDRSTQQQPQQSQSLPSTQTGDATTGAVPGVADAEDRTTQANEPGPGVRQGSNEGGSDRETTAEQPTATPGTGQVLRQHRRVDRYESAINFFIFVQTGADPHGSAARRSSQCARIALERLSRPA